MERILSLDTLRMTDVARAGGKNASLGEMIGTLSAAGVRVPGGFATTADAFREFLARDGLAGRIRRRLAGLDVSDVRALAAAGGEIRGWIGSAPLPPDLERELRARYAEMAAGDPDCAVAVRSSATAEDLPEASFAGQQETLLNVRGADALVDAVREVFASLYNDRAIAYRVHQGYAHDHVALSAGIQRMARSDLGASGVAFTIDTESGFEDVVLVTAAWGLGELVVQGQVNPDEFYVHKPNLEAGRPAILRRERGSKAQKMVYGDDPEERVAVVDVPVGDRHRFSLSDDDVIELARCAVAIERHYGRAMDIEWARDGVDGRIWILQARPETVQSRLAGQSVERFELRERGEVLAEGRSIGQRIGAGAARLVLDAAEMDKVRDGDVLVTDMTDPDWEPVMKRTAAIVTNRGGRTCHAAIIARELGIPAVVGTGDATRTVGEGTEVTVSCAEGDTGFVYAGRLDFELRRLDVETMPALPFKVAMNVGNPDRAFSFRALPNAGVGLARLEFIIGNSIGVHPRALLEFDRLPEPLRDRVRERIAGYESPGVLLRREAGGGGGDHRGRVPPEAGHRAPVGLQVRRVRQPGRRRALRARRGEPDARVPRGVALRVGRLPRELRDGVPRHAPGARRDGLHQRRAHGPVRAHPRRGARGRRAARPQWPGARPQRAAHGDDVRGAVERHSRGGVPGALRRLLHRLERPDPDDPGPRPELGACGVALRRARPCGEGVAAPGHRRLPQEGQVRGDLRPGAVRSPGPGPLADGAGDRQRVAQSGHGGGDVVVPGESDA